ncbi:MAG: hypothetical protein AAF442_06380 [Pseudomonadota bacterium]
MATQGRTLPIGPTDNTSEQRTPRARLHLIPTAARASFVPFVPVRGSLRQGETDLTRVTPDRPRAQGTAIEVSGTVRTASGTPVRGGLLEIWNANTFGRYTHIEDCAPDVPIDPNFLGMGRVETDEKGQYCFWTISPGAYLARPDIGRWRPKHIHLSLAGGASRLITQMYFPNEPNNVTDPMAILMGEDFHRNIGVVYQTPERDVDHGYRFDIIVGGRNATFFE